MLLLSLLALGATTAPTLAMPGLNAVNITDNEAALHSEVLAQELLRRGVQVTTARDISTMLGAERQKQLMGCGEQSCIAELANALGADGLIQGDVGKVDAQWSLTVRILSSQTGKTLAAFSGQSKENIAALLDHAARLLAQQLSDALHLGLVPVPEASAAKPVSRWWAVLPAAVAVGGGVVGALFTSQAQHSLADLRAARYREDAIVLRDAGQQQQTVAWVGFGVGLAGAIGAVTILMVGGEVTPTIAMDSRGATVGIAGVLP